MPKLLLYTVVFIFLLGVVWNAGFMGFPFGKITGDIVVGGGSSAFYFPVASAFILGVIGIVGHKVFKWIK